jgi:hypothetical protein
MRPSIGQDWSHPSSSQHVWLTCQTLKMPLSPLSHQLHHTCHHQLDSPQPPALLYPPRALSLPPPFAHQPPLTMIAMLIMPYGLVMRLVTTTVPVTATLELQQGVIVTVRSPCRRSAAVEKCGSREVQQNFRVKAYNE